MHGSTPWKRTFHPSRAKGQSFLRQPEVVDRIVTALRIRPDDVLLEVGAGAGQMTLPLAASGPSRILAVEAEPSLADQLERSLAERRLGQVEVVRGDFLSIDLPHLLASRGLDRARVVGNLPYSAASPMLLKLLAHRHRFLDLTLMFQREVADRLVARPSTKAYGVLTVMTQQAARARVLFEIPPHAFWPRPKIWSALVRLDFLKNEEPEVGDPEIFKDVVKTLFAYRRKNIGNNIRHLKSKRLDGATLRQGLEALHIDPSRRAETLAVEEFAALSHFCTSPR
jgi:16S rRNA (adenine1518-N6/adenine1519-N6)-dimethyltransferase